MNQTETSESGAIDPSTAQGEGVPPERFLTFQLKGEEYGIDIMKIQEIIGLVPITALPTAPAYCRGVINLRDIVIPTIDLRIKLGMESVEDTERTCIIIVEVQGAKGQIQFGLVVDEVAEVLHVSQAEMNPAPDYGGSLDSDFIQGIGVVGGQVKIFLERPCCYIVLTNTQDQGICINVSRLGWKSDYPVRT